MARKVKKVNNLSRVAEVTGFEPTRAGSGTRALNRCSLGRAGGKGAPTISLVVLRAPPMAGWSGIGHRFYCHVLPTAGDSVL